MRESGLGENLEGAEVKGEGFGGTHREEGLSRKGEKRGVRFGIFRSLRSDEIGVGPARLGCRP